MYLFEIQVLKRFTMLLISHTRGEFVSISAVWGLPVSQKLIKPLNF